MSVNQISRIAGFESDILQAPNLIRVGRRNTEGYFSMPKHYHPTTEILLITKGNAHIEIENKHLYAKERSLIVYPSSQTHFDEFFTGSDGAENYYIRLTDFQIRNLPSNHILPPDMNPILATGDLFDEIHLYFRTIDQESTLRNPGCSSIVNNALMCIILIILRLSKQLQNHPEKTSSAQDLCRKALMFISRNYSDCVNARNVSEALNISYSHLNHVFRQEMEKTLAQYITFYRILKAGQLLLLSRYDPHEIATMVGYKRYSIFSDHFLQQTSMYPEEYRIRMDPTSEESAWDHVNIF